MSIKISSIICRAKYIVSTNIPNLYKARDFFLDNINHSAFWDFAFIQTANHPIHRATLVRVDNIGEIIAGLFRFLAYYRVNFSHDEGVLLNNEKCLLLIGTKGKP